MSIYPYLRPLWAALAVSALVNLASLTDSMTILMIANVINLLCYAVVAFVLYRLSDESARFGHAFPARLFSVALIGLALVCTAFNPENPALLNFLSLLSLAGSVAGLLSEYYMYWALDERMMPCAYNYPARRIRWCFYAPLLGAFVASPLMLIGQAKAAVLLQCLTQFIPLILLRQYMQAVKAREDDPLSF